LKRLYNIGIYPEWWKLEPMDAAQWQAVDALIAERDPYCRGVVLLGLSAGVEQLNEGFRAAAQSATCRGFTVGRTIFHEASQAWLANEIDDGELIARVRHTFETLIASWRATRGDQPAQTGAASRVHQEQAA
jgi:5-dehydro-2-deoxygluconokinase